MQNVWHATVVRGSFDPYKGVATHMWLTAIKGGITEAPHCPLVLIDISIYPAPH